MAVGGRQVHKDRFRKRHPIGELEIEQGRMRLEYVLNASATRHRGDRGSVTSLRSTACEGGGCLPSHREPKVG